MKKFWITLFIALFGASLAGERVRGFLLDGMTLLSRDKGKAVGWWGGQPSHPQEVGGFSLIGKRLDGFASVLVAAAGSSQDIVQGYRAITYDDVYVGRIRQVSRHASQIVLASRPGERMVGWVPVLSVPLELEGWGSGLFHALVPANFPLEVGDEVWYDARLDAFVGTITAIGETKNAEGGELKEILVRHELNPFMLSSVRIHP